MSTEEPAQKPMENLQAKRLRKSLFGHLSHVILLADEKIDSKGNSDRAKQGWCRVLISAVAAGGALIKDSEIQELSERLDRLEVEMKCKT